MVLRSTAWAVAIVLAGCPQEIVGPGDRAVADRGPRDAEIAASDGAADGSALYGGREAGFDDATVVRFDARVGLDASADAGFDAGPEVGFDSGVVPGPDVGSLDPELSLPDPSGDRCLSPGTSFECPLLELCRFYTPNEGRCESCGPCGNLGASCTSSSECDILFMCHRGFCVGFCELGRPQCGKDACQDIGHPTRGVCPNS